VSVPPLDSLGTSSSRRTQKSAIEEVADKNDAIQSTKKKKVKKKKNHNKNQDTRTSPNSFPVQQSPSTSPSPSTSSKAAREAPTGSSLSQHLFQSSQDAPKLSKLSSVQQSMPDSPTPLTPSKRAKQPLDKDSPSQSSLQSSLGDVDSNFSRTSLPLAHEITAQSARAYMQSGNLTTEKTKVKTRPAFAGSFFKVADELKDPKENGTETTGLLNRMKKKINLPKRISDSMVRLISSADGKTHAKQPMKWEEFLKVC
jgi:hypothetical protein